MRFMSVDLPEPDGPMIATYSPALDAERHAGEGVHLLLPHLVDLRDVPDVDQHGTAELPCP